MLHVNDYFYKFLAKYPFLEFKQQMFPLYQCKLLFCHSFQQSKVKLVKKKKIIVSSDYLK